MGTTNISSKINSSFLFHSIQRQINDDHLYNASHPFISSSLHGPVDLQLLAQPCPVPNLRPVFCAWRRDSIENAIGIPLPPGSQQTRVVTSPEGILPVGLEGIRLVDVGRTVRSHGSQGRVDDVRVNRFRAATFSAARCQDK